MAGVEWCQSLESQHQQLEKSQEYQMEKNRKEEGRENLW